MPSNDSFVHLHVHSEYSMLDGAARVKPLIEAAKEQGMPAVAVTDHGNVFGAFDFYLQGYADVFPSPGVRGRFAEYLALEHGGTPHASTPGSADEHPALRAFADVRPYDYTAIAKSVFLGRDHTAFDRVVEGLGAEFSVLTGTIPHLGRGSGEVSLAGVNKGTTILRLLELLGLPVASSIGIGDSSNDVEMLELCGVGIAMGNAIDEIKARADEVTTSVLDDGVWNAFRRHGLI